MLQGRVGQSVKAREIFLYPRQIEDLVIAVPGLSRAQAVITREGHRDHVSLRLALQEGTSLDAVSERVQQQFRALSRLKADSLDVVPAVDFAADAPFIKDERT